MRPRNVPLARPDHPEDPAALLETLRTIILSGRWTEGEYAASFERRVAEICGTVYAIATNSGTSAQELILAALGLEPGSEVICPSYTFIATVNAILSRGSTPVFADIERETFNLDLADVERRLTRKTRALVLVHQFGIPSDGYRFVDFCKTHNLILIEDGACGLGSKFKEKSIGTFASAGLLSFHPRKVLSTGEGGMVVTDEEALSKRSRSIGNHGREKGKPAQEVGHNFRMSEFQAALGLWALDRLPEAISRRVAISNRYDEALGPKAAARVVQPRHGALWNRQSYPVRVPGDKREIIANSLRKEGIETSPGPYPAHLHKYIEHMLHPPRLPETEAAYQETLLLPMYAALTPDDQAHVIDTLLRSL